MFARAAIGIVAASAAWIGVLVLGAGAARSAPAAAGTAVVGTPCVAAGLLALVSPTGHVPQPVGPALTAADRQSTSADGYTDTTAGTGLSIEHIAIGAAGCLDAAGTPGGTTTRVAAWNVLNDAVGGSSLQADLVPASGDGTGWKLRPNLSGLLMNGSTATVEPGATLAIGNWGVLDRPGTIDAGAAAAPLRWWKAALELRFTHAHAGFATGTRFLIGWVSADRPPAAAPPPPVTTTTTTTTPPPPPPRKATHRKTVTTTTTTTTVTSTEKKTTHRKAVAKKAAQRKAVAKKARRAKRLRQKRRHANSILSGRPLAATPSLGDGKYDFPVLGTASWGDTYGAGRSDVPGGWHHGDDLFVALGTPVVAVADGTVFSVGWNAVGGWRLWLEDAQGNDFYYAHLSGYTKLAHNNNHVRRGQVLGFVGNTGDAFTTIPHLHFEVHPFGLLSLGYDGAVDPTTYLAGWERPGSVDVLPPVPLPSPNFRGSGSLTDFRRLLVLRPLAKPPAPPADGGGGGSGSSQSAPKTGAVASQPIAASASGGWVPAAAGAFLLLLAAVAVVLTAREGRSG